MKSFVQKILPNGVRVLFVPMEGNPTTTVLVLTATGSQYEKKEINGISHFLEHLCFKGTKKRPAPRLIAEELDGIGAIYNAFTGDEYTGYYAKAAEKHSKKIFDVVSDIFLNSTFPPEEIQKEMGVVIGEIDMYDDEPQSLVGDEMSKLLYGDQPAGWTTLGPKEVIKKLSREDIVGYHQMRYVSEATLVVVAGVFNQEEMVTHIQETFGSLPKKAHVKKVSTVEAQKKPQVAVHYKDTNQTHLIISFRTFSLEDKRVPVLKVLSGILGAGMSSRLFVKVREELGLGYYVGSHDMLSTDHGFLALNAGVGNDRSEEAIHAILEEVRKLRQDGVSEGELRKVKDLLVGNMYLSLERSNDLASFYGMPEILGLSPKDPAEREHEIRRVSSEDIKILAEIIFRNEVLNLAVVGPHKSHEKFGSILSV